MINFFNKATLIVIFPGVILTAAAFPFSCSLNKDGGVFRSDNFGINWEQKVKISDKQTIGTKNILSLSIDPINPSILYLGTDDSGLYKSSDEAETWQPTQDKNNILDKRAAIYDIEINLKNPNLIFLAAYQNEFGGVFRSSNGGENWEEVYVVPQEELLVTAVEIDDSNDAILYIGISEGGIFKSSDFGSSWRALGWFQNTITDIKVDPKDNQVVYFTTAGNELYQSINQGSSWQSLTEKISKIEQTPTYQLVSKEKISLILIDWLDSKILYFTSGDSIFKSFDRGENWQRLNILTPTESVSILTMAQDFRNPNNFYYGAGAAVYRTSNAGQTWTVSQIASQRKVRVIKIDPLDSNIIYVGMHN